MKFSKTKRVICSLMSVLMVSSFVPMHSVVSTSAAVADNAVGLNTDILIDPDGPSTDRTDQNEITNDYPDQNEITNGSTGSSDNTDKHDTHTFVSSLDRDNQIIADCSGCDESVILTFTLDETTYAYDGTIKTPTVCVTTSNGDTLENGVDYIVECADSTNAGTYDVSVVLQGNYAGTKTLSYEILPAQASDCIAYLSQTSYYYGGFERHPEVTVNGVDGTQLILDIDYVVAYKNCIYPGIAEAVITMMGNYTGEIVRKYTIYEATSNNCNVVLSQRDFTYNGKVQVPTVKINDFYSTLVEGRDYYISYPNSKYAGTYSLNITFCGNYKGKKTVYYYINPISIDDCEVELSETEYNYDGTVKTPSVLIMNPSGEYLSSVQYKVDYDADSTEVGTYNVVVSMRDSNYTGTKTLTYKINQTSVNACKFKLSKTSYTYNAKVQSPKVTVMNSNGTTLTNGTHYKLTFPSDRKNVGTYNITVTMIGNYTGTKTLSYEIKPVDISKCTLNLSKTSYTYNAKVQSPKVTVMDADGTTLANGTHYTLTIPSGRKNVGTYNITVTMIGNYTGTKTLSYKINPIDISKCTLSLSTTNYTYNGKAKTPTVTVKNAGGATLTKGTHFTVKYPTGRVNVGTYNVAVTMKGNYTGTKNLSFVIKPPKTTVNKLTGGSKAISVLINNTSDVISGYQIMYSTKSDFSTGKTKTAAVTASELKKSTKTVKLYNLTSNKTYYVKVRTYKTVDGVNYYSGWSTYMTCKAK